jgi:hypothetical protein
VTSQTSRDSAIEAAIMFLKSVDWNDATSETEAGNIIEALRSALRMPEEL